MSASPSAHGADLDAPAAAPVRRAVLALGSNLGERFASLQGAVSALASTPAVHLVAVSPVYETRPVGGPADASNFLNAVVLADTTLGSLRLLERAREVEEALGRVRGAEAAPRTLDIDLVLFGTCRSDSPELTLPHPRAFQRAFVLRPWLDIDPTAQIPGHGRVADLLARVDLSGVRRRDDLELVV